MGTQGGLVLGTLRHRFVVRDSRVAAERTVSWVRLAIASSMAVVVAFDGRESVPYPRAAWIILTAALSFIGLGAVPPAPEWGAMIAAGQTKFEYWWVATFPGLAILSVVLGFNFLGDGLQDLLNPRLRDD